MILHSIGFLSVLCFLALYLLARTGLFTLPLLLTASSPRLEINNGGFKRATIKFAGSVGSAAPSYVVSL
jgi:hypothetical protein